MKKLLLCTIVILLMSSCQKEDSVVDSSFSMKVSGADYSGYPATVQTVSGTITTNTTWTNDRVWEISGIVTVKNGAILTIEAGTFIKAKFLGNYVATGILLITKTGRIDVQGTATAPVIFTSYNLLDGNTNTVAAPGDFGGVIVLGAASTNTFSTTNLVEGLGDQPISADFYYGGSDDTHNSGAFNYVRIEFAGRILDANSGLSALTFAGVGSNTIVDHVQVSYSRDDSFEFLEER